MVVEAASLAVMSILHLTGHLDGSSPFNPTRAGIAEALIGVVLLLGALALVRSRRHALSIAIAANAFAVVGFVIGLTRTTEGGGAVDIAYHVTSSWSYEGWVGHGTGSRSFKQLREMSRRQAQEAPVRASARWAVTARAPDRGRRVQPG
jgi:hypothetical protein